MLVSPFTMFPSPCGNCYLDLGTDSQSHVRPTTRTGHKTPSVVCFLFFRTGPNDTHTHSITKHKQGSLSINCLKVLSRTYKHKRAKPSHQLKRTAKWTSLRLSALLKSVDAFLLPQLQMRERQRNIEVWHLSTGRKQSPGCPPLSGGASPAKETENKINAAGIPKLQ